MKPTAHLATLERAAGRRALLLRTLADTCAPPVTPEVDRLISFLSIEIQNLFASFCRSYYLSCVMCATTTAGARITIKNPSIRSFSDALTYAVQTFNPRLRGMPGPFTPRDEPAWHDVNVLLRLVRDIGASSLPQVTAALGHPTTVFSDLPVFRNFFAHRCEDTAIKATNVARRYSLSSQLRPSEILCSRRAGRPQIILSDWADDLYAVITGVCR